MLFVSDLDGTLLNNEATLSARTVSMLNVAIERGADFTVATARTPATVDVIMSPVKMKLPAIVMTGAAWWHFDSKSFSHLHFFTLTAAKTVYSIFRKYGIVPFIYTLKKETTSRFLEVFYNNTNPSDADRKFIEVRKELELKRFIIEECPQSAFGNVLLFFASGEKDVLERISEKVKKITRCSVSCYEDIYNPGLGLIEIFSEGVSKAAAILEMKKAYGFDAVTVFGDNHNDISMFDIADISVSVANGAEIVRERADKTIGANTEDAVAKEILNHSEMGNT